MFPICDVSSLYKDLLFMFICSKVENKIPSLRIFCDSDWAGDPETRISVQGFYWILSPVFLELWFIKFDLVSQVISKLVG
jgi:hypothetical protein